MYTEKDVIDTLLQKIYYATSAPDIVSGTDSPRRILSVCFPGIPYPAKALDFGFATMSTDQVELAADFSLFVNTIPLFGKNWTPTGKTTWAEYEKILTQVVLPKASYSAGDVKDYEKAKSFLFVTQKLQDPSTGQMTEIVTESLWVQRYFEFKRNYSLAVQSYNKEFATYMNKPNDPATAMYWAKMKPILEDDIVTALKRWEGNGKAAVEKAWATIGNFDSRGMQATWQDRRTRFTNYRSGSGLGNFYLTKYIPQKFWEEGVADGAGWFGLTLTHDEIHTVDQKEQVSWGGGGSFGSGLWRVGGDASYESMKTSFASDAENISISLELATIPLLRGWLDMNLIEGRNWKYDTGTVPANYVLTDGKIPPSGVMPMMPEAAVFVRNVKISFDKKTQNDTTAMEQVRGSVSAGWGPFSARANYFKRTDKATHDFVEDAAGITIPGLQIIGFVCRLLDKAPDPDQALNWP